MSQQHLEIVPMTFRQASGYVAMFHRHHKPPRGTKFCIGVQDESEDLRGVAMVGRPLARAFDTGRIAEVNRTCTDGCPNANSALYGASWRAAKAMGYLTIITYTQEGESGISLRAAGWRRVREIKPRGSWLESTADPRLREMRDAEGAGKVSRILWAQGDLLPEEVKERVAA